MKDSGIAWVGEIPDNWEIVKLKYIADVNGRIGFRGYTESDLVDEGEGAITLSPSNIADGKMNYNKCSYISWKKYDESPEIQIKNGDILFVKTGSSYGKSCFVSGLYMEATINPQLAVLKNIKIDNKFLSYSLKTESVEIQSELAVVGGTIPTMSQTKIGNFIIVIPKLSEQQKIADYLDKKCGEIDGLINDIKTQIETLEQYKRSEITESVTKGLNKSAPMKDSGIAWVGEIPDNWEIRPLYYCFSEHKNKNYLGKEQNLLSLSYGKIIKKDINTKEGLLPDNFNSYNIVESGDIIIRPTDLQNDQHSLRTGLVIEKGIITSAYISLRAKIDLNSKFYNYLLHSYDIQKVFYNMGNGVRQGLNYDEFSKLKLVFLPIEQQKQIADYLDKKCAEIDKIISDKQSQIETLEEYKKSLIFEYVTGKKQVE